MDFDLEGTVKKLALPFSIAFSAGLARFVFSDQRSIYSFLRGLILAGFVGLITSVGLRDVAIAEGTRGFIIGITAFCADEVLMIFVKIAVHFREDPVGKIQALIAFRKRP